MLVEFSDQHYTSINSFVSNSIIQIESMFYLRFFGRNSSAYFSVCLALTFV